MILALTLGIYGHTLSFPFVFDDRTYLIGNPLLKDLSFLKCWLTPKAFAALPLKMGIYPDVATNMMLRPFAYFSFYLSQTVAGSEPAGFRVVNIFVHACNGCLLFLILRHILMYSRLERPKNPESCLFIPLVSALVFVAHPIQVESVTYIIQRFTSMAGCFFLLTIWIYLVACETADFAARMCLRAISVLVAILGMLTKESVCVMPLIVVLIDGVLMGNGFKTVLRRSWPILVSMLIVPVLVVFVAWAQSDGGVSFNEVVNVANTRDSAQSQPTYFLNEFRIIIHYIGLLLIPMGLNIDPDVRVADSLSDWRILLSGCVIVGILATSWSVFRRRRTDLRRAMIFVFTLWFFGVIAICSGIAPLPDLMAEHRTYIPSMGALTVLVCAVDLVRTDVSSRGFWRYGVLAIAVLWGIALSFAILRDYRLYVPLIGAILLLVLVAERIRTEEVEKRAWRFVFPSAAAMWVGILFLGAVERNEVWRTRRSLWEDSVRKSPNKARTHINLGACHGDEGRLDLAEECFQKGVNLAPETPPAHENLVTVLNARSKFNEALQACEIAVSRGIDTWKIRHNFGVALFNVGRHEEGLTCLYSALERSSDLSLTYRALGQAHSALKQPQKALTCFRRAAAAGGESPQIVQNIQLLEAQLGESDSANVSLGR